MSQTGQSSVSSPFQKNSTREGLVVANKKLEEQHKQIARLQVALQVAEGHSDALGQEVVLTFVWQSSNS